MAETLLIEGRSDAEVLLRSNVDVVEALRDALLERDELVGDEITDVITGVLRTRAGRVLDVRQAGTLGGRRNADGAQA